MKIHNDDPNERIFTLKQQSCREETWETFSDTIEKAKDKKQKQKNNDQYGGKSFLTFFYIITVYLISTIKLNRGNDNTQY